MRFSRKQEQKCFSESEFEHENILSAILESLPVAVFAKDIKNNFRFTIWNKTAEEIFGIKAADCIGKNDYDFFPNEQADFFRKKDIEASKSEIIIDIPEETAKTPKGTLLLHTKKIVIRDSTGAPSILLGITNDVTEQKRAAKSLIHSAKMASLGEMAGGLAHEINNPLTIILGKSDLIKKVVQKNPINVEKITIELGKIEENALRISKIVKGFKSFSTDTESLPFTKVKLATILHDTLELCSERICHQDIRLDIFCPTDIELECKPAQISQILMNVLTNSREAIEPYSEKWIKIEAGAVENKVHICITDSGNGIPLVISEKMMQPFFTTKGIGKNMGLGLSICDGICKDHNGSIQYDALNKNTKFIISLPLKQNNATGKN